MTGPAVADRERTEQPDMGRLVGPTWRRVAGLGPERLVAAILVVGAVGFTGIGLARLVHQRDIDVVTLPLALLAADLLIGAALVTGWYPIRAVAQGLAIFGALVHVLVLLRSGPWWIRGWSGMLTVAHLSALVLFFSLTAREYEEPDTADEDAEPSDNTVEPASSREPATRSEAAVPPVESDEPDLPSQPEQATGRSEQPEQDAGRSDQPEQDADRSDQPEQDADRSDQPEQDPTQEERDEPAGVGPGAARNIEEPA